MGRRGEPSRPTVSDTWAHGGSYERFMGRWSALVAREFVGWLGPAPGARWLDVGCGTGALVRAVLAGAAPTAVLGVDRSPLFLAEARRRTPDPRARFAAADAGRLPLRPAPRAQPAPRAPAFDYAVSALALNFLPAPDQALKEWASRVRAGGVVAAYVWDYAGGMQFLRTFWDEACALDPTAAKLDEGRRFPLCDPARLAVLFRAAGLAGVAVTALEVDTVFRDFDDYWRPFLGGQGPAPGYLLGLSGAARDALRERLRRRLPADARGGIALRAAAWAVQGVVAAGGVAPDEEGAGR